MRTIRNIIIIIIILLIFIFVFAGQGIFDNYLPLLEAKGAVVTTFKGGVFDMENGGYVVKSGDKDAFVDSMLDKGWALKDIGDNGYTFEKEGQQAEYKSRDFMFFFKVYEMVE